MRAEEEDALFQAPSAVVRTRGRRTGRPHRVIVWFAYRDGMVYFLAHARENGRGTDWYQNLMATGEAEIEAGGVLFSGSLAELPEQPERAVATVVSMFENKYGNGAIASWYSPGARIAVCLKLDQPASRGAEPVA